MVKAYLSFDELSFEEQTAVSQLKQAMIGCMNEDLYEDLSVFVRFVRARDLNINAAVAMLKHHIEWRKIIQIDAISNYTPKEVLQNYVTFNTFGLDKGGSPILYFNVGGLDPRGILKSARKIDVTKCVVKKLEANVALMRRQSFKLGQLIDKWTMILNFENLSFANATHKQTLEVIGSLITMYEAHYPERLKVAYFINSSIYFTMAFAVVKHFLSGPTFRKIKFFGKEGWKEELLKIIDPEVLPTFLGGSRTDPDGNPLCHSIITHGGIIPEKYFINKKENSLANIPGVEKLTVTRMSKTQLTLEVKEPGSRIEWEFETKSRDIGFSLMFKKSKGDSPLEELIPKQRIETGISSETGVFKCDKLGYYVIEFDNTYSWIHQKEIYYKVSVVATPLIS